MGSVSTVIWINLDPVKFRCDIVSGIGIVETIVAIIIWTTGIRLRLRTYTDLEEGGIKAATEECEKTAGPVASIFHAGLSRANKGITYVEKAITTAGSLEMAFLERGICL